MVGPLSGERNKQGGTCLGPCLLVVMRLIGAVFGELYTSVLETVSLLCSHPSLQGKKSPRVLGCRVDETYSSPLNLKVPYERSDQVSQHSAS